MNDQFENVFKTAASENSFVDLDADFNFRRSGRTLNKNIKKKFIRIPESSDSDVEIKTKKNYINHRSRNDEDTRIAGFAGTEL